jgi:hypothetical protein
LSDLLIITLILEEKLIDLDFEFIEFLVEILKIKSEIIHKYDLKYFLKNI